MMLFGDPPAPKKKQTDVLGASSYIADEEIGSSGCQHQRRQRKRQTGAIIGHNMTMVGFPELQQLACEASGASPAS
jgi:hypothetical protein